MRVELKRRAPRQGRDIASVSLRALAIILAMGVAGCSSRLGQFTNSLRDVRGEAQGVPTAQPIEQLARAYDARPGEKRASLAYAERLRATGQHAQAVAVLEKASIQNVGDREVAAAYGKALADIGRFDEAMKVLSQAHTADRPDWRVLSTQGAIADQQGNHDRAREFYHQALQIAPEEPAILTNLALSHVLTRDLTKAEELLQRAASRPNAAARTHANLELVRSLRQQAKAAPAARSAQTTPNRVPRPTNQSPKAE